MMSFPVLFPYHMTDLAEKLPKYLYIFIKTALLLITIKYNSNYSVKKECHSFNETFFS